MPDRARLRDRRLQVSTRYAIERAVLACALVVAAACGARASSVDGTRHATATSARRDGNIERADYVGSVACAKCHAAEYAAWQQSPMHRMTRAAKGAEIAAPFDAGAELRFKADVAHLERRGDDRFVKIDSPRGSSLYRVTKVLGGHHREDFVGVSVPSMGAAPSPNVDEEVLPVSFLRASQSLRYKGYSVMLRERPHLQAGPTWKKTCIFCHNTVPYFSSVLGALTTRGRARYQGAVVDAMLPRDRAWHYEVTDVGAFDAALDDEMHALGAATTGRARLAQTIDATRARFGEAQLVELGIGCESCHGGGRAHAESPSSVKPSYTPRASFLRVTPQPSDAQAKTHVCARCHQVLFSRYPWTWEGGRRNEDAGGSHITSGEARDFLLGGCAGAMTCTACHDPHAADATAKMREVDSIAGNRICLDCHAKYKGDDALRAHAHHDPRGEAGVCIRCHMPKKNMTLDSTLGRYHRIGSPSDPTRVLRDRPLECALCHADKSTESLVSTMETWWNKRYDRTLLRALYSDLDRPNLLPTLASGKPHEQAVAMFVLGAQKNRAAAALTATQTVNAYPLVREYARAALDAMLGRSCGIDLGADVAIIERTARACLAAAGVSAPSDAWAAAPPDGDMDPGED